MNSNESYFQFILSGRHATQTQNKETEMGRFYYIPEQLIFIFSDCDYVYAAKKPHAL
jgi:hypothetical protein